MKHPDSLSLESVVDEPLQFGCELTVPVTQIDREPLKALAPLELSGQISRIEGGYALDANLAYGGELECSRCLAPYAFREDDSFSLVLYPRVSQPAPEVELDRGDLDVVYFDEPVVALSPIAEERVQMGLPMKPLCRPDCKGLCPGCGSDLNQSPCACAAETTDPRWDALKALREKV
jgi:uncharacterized protein